ncbi:N,N-dimethylformamidase beta subunit family domain-containing protein [Streptosporangium sp. NPDC051022]|uniref:N,N-dimethylformamidase beta subunit family domain-containing protein n=1 Tax=Streptosporangium sp. NPDC051022 TaxID=3155752 RepID=UPI003425BB97
MTYAWSVPTTWMPEKPGEGPEIWCYADRFSYDPGDVVALHVHTTAETYDVEVIADGARPRTVFRREGLPGVACETPEDSYATGCGWPVALTVPVEEDWPSGFYLVIVRIMDGDRVHEREGFFVVRPGDRPKAPIAMVLTTSTMLAYNDWGGANHYRGLPDGAGNDIPTPLSSARRPLARGLCRKPVGAPRNIHTDTPEPGWIPRHPPYEWALHNGYSRHHADAFWATYERPFMVWAQEQGYEIDVLTQHDLHFEPEILDGYSCALFVGHDEYWTWEMRDAVDRFVDRGGKLARFAGNFVWQVRLSADGGTQTCHKMPQLDPLLDSDPARVTTAWDWPPIGRPAAETMGLTGLGGVYIRYGNCVPRASGGFTVYRPHHWAFEGTDLYYGDVFGGAPICVAAFEVDGVEYTFRRGLPYATGEDGAPDGLEILAMAPAVTGAEDRWRGQVPFGAPAAEVADLLRAMYDGDVPEHLDKEYGAGMIASFARGAGEVFNAGSCEWGNGLIHRDPFTERITRNVLDRFTATAGETGAAQETGSAERAGTTAETGNTGGEG